MMHFVGEYDGEYMLGIGLSRHDIEKLLEGNYCTMSGEEAFGIPHIMIMFGEDDMDCIKRLKDLGVVDPDAKMHFKSENESRRN